MKDWRKYTDVPPPISDEPVVHLRHTLAHYKDEPDDRLAIVASANIYERNLHTGLTWGDLRSILKDLDDPLQIL